MFSELSEQLEEMVKPILSKHVVSEEKINLEHDGSILQFIIEKCRYTKRWKLADRNMMIRSEMLL